MTLSQLPPQTFTRRFIERLLTEVPGGISPPDLVPAAQRGHMAGETRSAGFNDYTIVLLYISRQDGGLKQGKGAARPHMSV